MKKGFTLIEVLITLSVAIVIGTVVSSVFLSSLKGTTKTTVVSKALGNGSYALSQIQKILRNAQSISSPPYPCIAPTPTPVQTLTLTDGNGATTIISCANSTINVNGSSLLDTENLSVSLGSCSFSCVQASLADYPSIKVNFTVTQKNTTSFFEQKATIPFQTSVTLRSLKL